MKKLVIGLLFLGVVLLTANFISASLEAQCYDGSTNCIHEDYDLCLSSQVGKQGCWSEWGISGITTCTNRTDDPYYGGYRWYSGYQACNYQAGESCIETSPGVAQCLKSCTSLNGFCTLYPSGEHSEADGYCPISAPNCIKCSVGEPVGTYPNQNCQAPEISIRLLGGSYYTNSISESGNAWAVINLTDGLKFDKCWINWQNPPADDTWRQTI